MTKDHVLINLSESDKTQFLKVDFVEQRTPQKVLSAIWDVESELNNGGFAQYFFNSSGASAHFVAQALEMIGAPKTADICKRAIAALFPLGLPDSQDEIRAAAAEFPEDVIEKLEALDEEFFAYPHNLTDLLFEFVSKHPEEFGPLPKPDDA